MIYLFCIKIKNNKSINTNNVSSIYHYSVKSNNNETINLNILEIKYFYSLKFNLVKIGYKIGFFDENNNLILPSDLALYYNIHILCYLQISKENIKIYTIPSIFLNKYYECIEFINLNEKIKLGNIFYSYNNENFNLILFDEKVMSNTKIYYLNNKIFDILNLKIESEDMLKNTNNLKKLYSSFPLFKFKRKVAIQENRWYFNNIYNNYFCFCKGYYCKRKMFFQKCKYFFYLNIIESNKNIYKKDNYLFLDFILKKYSSDDVYPIFKEMYNKNISVSYITEKEDLYEKYCFNKEKCLSIILLNSNDHLINGNFIEKYLTLILKLKQVISGGGIGISYIYNLFYNIEYIIYICVGHGVSFFKYFLYKPNNCYGNKLFHKILIPPSKKLISVAINNGWKEEDIIKINLPRWDKYNNLSLYLNDDSSLIKNNSIFVMFTWRQFKNKKYLSSYYFRNIFNLINNKKLNLNLKNKNISLYFSLHHKLNSFINIFIKNRNIHFLDENLISECLSKTNMVVSDFSSIIFDSIYQHKPFIIYIPDANDPIIKDIYDNNYYEVIEFLKTGKIVFKNKFFELEEAINKIIYYINNNYNLENEMKEFYDSFELNKRKNNTIDFINYIINIKL